MLLQELLRNIFTYRGSARPLLQLMKIYFLEEYQKHYLYSVHLSMHVLKRKKKYLCVQAGNGYKNYSLLLSKRSGTHTIPIIFAFLFFENEINVQKKKIKIASNSNSYIVVLTNAIYSEYVETTTKTYPFMLYLSLEKNGSNKKELTCTTTGLFSMRKHLMISRIF